MAEVLLDTYEVLQELGSGGGGVVYLARHNRLNKLVVLKADRRKITSSPSVLRREVESLKNLHHQNIPSVYDFFIENNTVYTVIDYIQGDSFDKLLSRSQRFEQAQVISWAKQLLLALDYLHSQPPHGILHADIKPANIMLTPEGTIRLIDFNIALVLGEEGAVAVGRSFGYASPEHYLNISELKLNPRATSARTTSPMQAETELDPALAQGVEMDSNMAQLGEDPRTLLQPYTQLSGETEIPHIQDVPPSTFKKVTAKSFTGDGSMILDCRSDIYSLGATLYHLFTGEKPEKNAKAVKPMSGRGLSRPVCAIIKKAMHPNPNKRYQTAKSMLKALDSLHRKDIRTKSLKTIQFLASVGCVSAFLLGGYWNQIHLSRQEATQTSLTNAEYSANALAEGNPTLALQYALASLPTPDGKNIPEYTAQGEYALSQALGIYYFNEGYHVARTVTLDSEILGVALSPNGETALALQLGSLTLIDVETGEILDSFPTEYSALSEFFFVDDNTIFYAGAEGVCLYDIPSTSPLWTGELGTRLAKSHDGNFFASLYKDESRAFVYDRQGIILKELVFEGFHQRVPSSDLFANPNDNIFSLSEDGKLLAISFEGGGFMVYDTTPSGEEAGGDLEFFDVSDFTLFSGGFYEDYLAFSCTGDDGCLFAIFDCRDLSQTGGFQVSSHIGVMTYDHGIYLNMENVVVSIHPVSGEQTEVAYTGDSHVSFFDLAEDGHILVLTEDFSYSFYDPNTNLIEKKQEGDDGKRYGAISNDSALMASLDSNLLKILTYQNYPDEQFAKYDSYFDHVECRVTADDQRIVLFQYENMQIYDLKGNLLGENTFTENTVYDQQYRREEGYLEIIYYDGMRGHYSDSTGELLEEFQGDVPDDSLDEWFETSRYRIFSPLHGNPEVYEKTSETPDVMVKQIDVADYLTYVTEIGEQFLLEFLSTDGARYGLLCNENLEQLAYLPNLTDYKDGYFYFDEGKGNIKREKMYNLEQLLIMTKGVL